MRFDALTLDEGVFSRDDPRSIARSLKRSAERSHRRKADPYRSAMSMLTFYINRAGSKLSASRRAKLQRAKQEFEGGHTADVIVTVHPSWLLRVPSEDRKAAYRDFVADPGLALPYCGSSRSVSAAS